MTSSDFVAVERLKHAFTTRTHSTQEVSETRFQRRVALAVLGTGVYSLYQGFSRLLLPSPSGMVLDNMDNSPAFSFSTEITVAASSSPQSETIPLLLPELYDLVAFHLALSGDKQTLLACSLVSSAWIAPTRKYLFREINLDCENYYRLGKLLTADPNCTFIKYVRVLRMREGEFVLDRWMENGLGSVVANIGDRLLEWDIYNLTWKELSAHTVNFLTTPKEGQEFKQGLRTLRVSTCYWERVDEFVSFVASFRGINHLVCESVLINCYEISEKPLLQLSDTLTSLYLHLPEELMLKYFITQHAIEGLKRLGFCIREQKLLSLTCGLVEKAGKTLEDLALWLPDSENGAEFCSTSMLKLSHNTSLRRLRIRLSFTNRPSLTNIGTNILRLDWIPELLETISSVHLSQISFVVDATIDLVQCFPWESFTNVLADLICRINHEQLKVSFIVSHYFSFRSRIRRELMDCLRKLEDSAKVKVQLKRVKTVNERERNLGDFGFIRRRND